MKPALFLYMAVQRSKALRTRRPSRDAPTLPCNQELYMNNLNTVLVEGLLTRDPERLVTSSESVACRLPVANNRYYISPKDGEWKQDTSFFNVTVFGPVADACLQYLKRGRGVRVVGRLKQLRYVEGGIRRERVTILAEHIEFAPEKKTEKEEIPEVEKIPGEIQAKADLASLIASAAAAAQDETPPDAEPTTVSGAPDGTEPQEAAEPDIPVQVQEDSADTPF